MTGTLTRSLTKKRTWSAWLRFRKVRNLKETSITLLALLMELRRTWIQTGSIISLLGIKPSAIIGAKLRCQGLYRHNKVIKLTSLQNKLRSNITILNKLKSIMRICLNQLPSCRMGREIESIKVMSTCFHRRLQTQTKILSVLCQRKTRILEFVSAKNGQWQPSIFLVPLLFLRKKCSYFLMVLGQTSNQVNLGPFCSRTWKSATNQAVNQKSKQW